MPVSLRGLGTALAEPVFSVNTTAFTLDHPTSLAAGDLMVVLTAASVFPASTGSITYDWGAFESVGRANDSTGSNDFVVEVAIKFATSADVAAGSTTFNVTEVGSGTGFRARMLAYAGTTGLVGNVDEVEHPLAGNGPSITVPVGARVLFATATRSNSVTVTTPTSPVVVNDGNVKATSSTSNLGATMWGINVESGTTTTLNYAADESTFVRCSVGFALGAADYPFPQVIFA